MSNRNTVLGFVFIFAILIGYYLITSPSKKELLERQHKMDSLAMVKRQQDSIAFLGRMKESQQQAPKERADSLAVKAQEKPTGKFSDLRDQFGVFAEASRGKEKMFYLESDLAKIGVSTKGGRITYVELKKYKTYDNHPLILIQSDTNQFGFTFFAGNRTINTSQFYFQPYWPDKSLEGQDTIRVSGTQEAQFALRLYTDNGDSSLNMNSYIEYLFNIRGDNYMLNYTVNIVNLDKTIDATRGYIDFEWSADLLKQEKIADRFNGSTVYYKVDEDKVQNLSESKNSEVSLKDKIKWVSFKEPFFSSTLIANTNFVDPIMRVSTAATAPSPRYLRSVYFKVGVPYASSPNESIGMSLYFGPNKYSILKKYRLDLERQIPLGWSFFLMQWINRYAVLPVFTFLGSFGWNYGIVILVLTILLKIVLYPIAYKSYLSSARMKVLKPEVDELNLKFPKKEDAMKKQQAMMALYKKAGVNPMAGCIPVLLQLPILLAMFRFFPASIELRQQSFLWASDLSSYDSILDLPFKIPFYGDHVSLFCLLMTISTIIYTWLNNQMMGTGSQQMPGMKTIMYIMPVMFLGVFNNYSSGLSYYYLLVNLITFAQMYVFRLVVDEEKIHRQIQENKAKPGKKSSFQKRLEDMAKKRGYNPYQSKK